MFFLSNPFAPLEEAQPPGFRISTPETRESFKSAPKDHTCHLDHLTKAATQRTDLNQPFTRSMKTTKARKKGCLQQIILSSIRLGQILRLLSIILNNVPVGINDALT